jgi:excisionase family DNA binding protein
MNKRSTSAAILESLADVLRPLVREVVREELDGFMNERLQERKRWLTLTEAADRLGCSPDAVRMRVRRGRLEHRYQGRRLYVSAEAVDRL